jgi:hypothetical protein
VAFRHTIVVMYFHFSLLVLLGTLTICILSFRFFEMLVRTRLGDGTRSSARINNLRFLKSAGEPESEDSFSFANTRLKSRLVSISRSTTLGAVWTDFRRNCRS